MIRWNSGQYVSAITLITLLLSGVAFYSSINIIYSSWSQEEYSYGYFVPLISILLLISKLRYNDVVIDGSWIGVIIVLISCVGIISSNISGINGIKPSMLFIFIVGIVVSAIGFRGFMQFLSPVFYVLFSFPLPRFMFFDISFNLQILSTLIGSYVLGFLGYSVYVEGNVIELGGYSLQVVEACSGLRYLLPLTSISFLLACMIDDVIYVRAIVFLSSIPISVIMNGIRIAVVGITVNHWGRGMADGFLHIFEGWVVFLICFFILLLEVYVIGIIRNSKVHIQLNSLWPVPLPRFKVEIYRRKPVLAALAVLSVTTLVVVALSLWPPLRPGKATLPDQLSMFPVQIGQWRGMHRALSPEALNILSLDDYFVIDYKNDDGNIVNYYIAFYGQQDSGSAHHSPNICIPGGGWEIVQSSIFDLNLKNISFPVNRVLIRKGLDRQLVYFWYDAGGTVLVDDMAVKFDIIKRAIQFKSTQGALVRVLTPIGSNEMLEDADSRLRQFMDSVYPVTKRALGLY